MIDRFPSVFLCFLLFFLFQLSSRSRTCFFLLCCAYQEAAKWWPIVGEFGIGIGDRGPFLPQVVPNSYPWLVFEKESSPECRPGGWIDLSGANQEASFDHGPGGGWGWVSGWVGGRPGSRDGLPSADWPGRCHGDRATTASNNRKLTCALAAAILLAVAVPPPPTCQSISFINCHSRSLRPGVLFFFRFFSFFFLQIEILSPAPSSSFWLFPTLPLLAKTNQPHGSVPFGLFFCLFVFFWNLVLTFGAGCRSFDFVDFIGKFIFFPLRSRNFSAREQKEISRTEKKSKKKKKKKRKKKFRRSMAETCNGFFVVSCVPFRSPSSPSSSSFSSSPSSSSSSSSSFRFIPSRDIKRRQ